MAGLKDENPVDVNTWGEIRSRLAGASVVLAAAGLYFPLNRLMKGGVALSTPLDRWVPLWPEWVAPYLLCLPFWFASIVWFAWKMDGRLFGSFVAAALFVLLSATTIYFLFPTYVERPILPMTDGQPTGNWAERLLGWVYQNDRVYNAFPSGHVYLTTLICLFFNSWIPGRPWFWTGLVSVVVLSTLFTPQHYLLDPVGGVALAWIGHRFGIYRRQVRKITSFLRRPKHDAQEQQR